MSTAFLDTTILVYATLQPDPRSDAARALLARGGVVSVQVLNEFAAVARRKLRRSWPEIVQTLDAIQDMRDGQVVEGRLVIRNPFAAP